MDLVEITEGATSLLVPARHADRDRRGPSRAGAGFYNPAMALTRDLTVLMARVWGPGNGGRLLDGLAATGARGLRVAVEAPGWTVELNDHHPHAAAVADGNVERLGLDVAVHRRDLRGLLGDSSWRFIEVDPYGSPVPFLPAACQAVRSGGVLALSATDTGALHGTRRDVCRRRYLAEPPPRRAPGWKAAALRLLVAHAVRTAAQFDVALTPLLVHEHGHAFRATLTAREGAAAADRALARLGDIVLCPACQTWGHETCACGKGRASGPYWLGPLQDAEVLARLAKEREGLTLAEPRALTTLLGHLADEARLGPFYLDTDEVARVLRVQPPATQRLVDALREAGIEAAVTHHGAKTVAYGGGSDAALEVVKALD